MGETQTYELTVTYPSWVETAVVLVIVWLGGVWYFRRRERGGFLFGAPWWWAWAWPVVLLLMLFSLLPRRRR